MFQFLNPKKVEALLKKQPSSPYDSGGEEPPLKEVLKDPMILLLAQCDKIEESDLHLQIESARKAIVK